MRVLARWDAGVIRALRRLLEIVEGWLSITQGMIERACIVLTILASHLLHPSHWPIQVILGLGMSMLHREPAAVRKARESDEGDIIWRICLQILLLLSLIFFAVAPGLPSFLNATEGSAITLFWYLVSIGDGSGKRGKRRRIAIARLKQILGARWTPEPVPA